MADPIRLGTTISSSSSSGSNIYNSDVRSYNYGALLTTPSAVINNTHYQDTTYLTGSIRAFDYTANSFAALGVTGGVGSGTDSFILGSGAGVHAITTGTAAAGQYNVNGASTYYYTESMYEYNRDMVYLAGEPVDYSSDEHLGGSSSGTDSFSTHTGLGLTYTYGATGTYSCNILASSYFCYTAPSSSSYTELTATTGNVVEDHTTLGAGYKVQTVGKASFTDTYVSTDWSAGSTDQALGVASVTTSYAVNTSGSLTLNGGNTVNGDTYAGAGINV